MNEQESGMVIISCDSSSSSEMCEIISVDPSRSGGENEKSRLIRPQEGMQKRAYVHEACERLEINKERLLEMMNETFSAGQQKARKKRRVPYLNTMKRLLAMVRLRGASFTCEHILESSDTMIQMSLYTSSAPDGAVCVSPKLLRTTC